MKTIKEIISTTFGGLGRGLGCVLWIVIGTILFTIPITLLPLRTWQQIALICIMYIFSETIIVGVLAPAIIWIWSFTIAINTPLDIYLIIYYISLAIYVFATLIPQIIHTIKFVYTLIVQR